jgi:cytochrome c oxidase subunit 2
MINKALGIVPNASEHGYLIDHMLEAAHWFMLLLFVGWSCFFLYTLYRFHHSRNPKADYHGVKTKVSTHLEFAVVLIEAVLLLGFALPIWAKRVNDFPVDDAVRVRVIGQQFRWLFHYPGADGVSGRQDVQFINAGNELGLDPADPAAADDIYSINELHLPQNKPAILEISSMDVIHSVSLQNMRSGQDAIPGTSTPMWFTPTIAGEYEIICGQLCGTNHYQMRGVMLVEPEADYQQWLKDTAAEQVKAPAPAPEPAPAEPQQPVEQSPSSPIPSQQPPESRVQEEPHPSGTPASAATPPGAPHH